MSIMQPLLDLQEIDGHIRDLLLEEKDIPVQKKEGTVRLEAVQDELRHVKEGMQQAQARVNVEEHEIQTRRDRIQTLKQQQSTLKTNREFQLYNLEIAKLEGEIDGHESRQVAAWDDIIPIKEELAEVEARVQEEQKVLDAHIEGLDKRLAAIKEQIAGLEQARAQASKQVQPKFLVYYERLRAKRWPVVVGLGVDDYVCRGCNMVQPPSVSQLVRRNNDIVACQMCGRILYSEQNGAHSA